MKRLLMILLVLICGSLTCDAGLMRNGLSRKFSSDNTGALYVNHTFDAHISYSVMKYKISPPIKSFDNENLDILDMYVFPDYDAGNVFQCFEYNHYCWYIIEDPWGDYKKHTWYDGSDAEITKNGCTRIMYQPYNADYYDDNEGGDYANYIIIEQGERSNKNYVEANVTNYYYYFNTPIDKEIDIYDLKFVTEDDSVIIDNDISLNVYKFNSDLTAMFVDSLELKNKRWYHSTYHYYVPLKNDIRYINRYITKYPVKNRIIRIYKAPIQKFKIYFNQNY